MSESEYEWGVGMLSYDVNTEGLHRGPMDEQAAREWVAEAMADFPGAKPDAFHVVRRPVGKWVRA